MCVTKAHLLLPYGPAMLPNRSQINPIQFIRASLYEIHLNMTHLRPDLKNVFFPSSFIAETLHVFLSSIFVPRLRSLPFSSNWLPG